MSPRAFIISCAILLAGGAAFFTFRKEAAPLDARQELATPKTEAGKSRATRDMNGARSFLTQRMETFGYSREDYQDAFGDLPACGDFLARLHTAHARSNPMAAWQSFLQDAADPRLTRLKLGGPEHFSPLFEVLAAKLPLESWQGVLANENSEVRQGMLEGYMKGVARGRDWRSLADEYEKLLATHGETLSIRESRAIAKRWVVEDPAAALDWFAAQTAEVDFSDSLRHLKKTEAWNEELAPGVNLLYRLYMSPEDRRADTVSALNRLLDQGQEPLVAFALSRIAENAISPGEIPLFYLVARLPSSGLREYVFSQIMKSVLSGSGSGGFENEWSLTLSHGSGSWNQTSESDRDPLAVARVNALVVGARGLAWTIDLPPEVTSEAKADLLKFERRRLGIPEPVRASSSDDPFGGSSPDDSYDPFATPDEKH